MSYRYEFSTKYRRWRFYTVIITIYAFSIYIIGDYFSGGRITNLFTSRQAPLPTAIDPNFSTQVNDCFIPTATAYGYTLRITTGFRSMAAQDALYQEGRTIDGHIVTEAPAGKSIHNYGFAVDVVDVWRGYKIDWTRLVKIGAYCGLESGGVGDLPHFEHRSGLTTADFAAGKRPPPLTLPCPVMAARAALNTPLTLADLKSCSAPNF